MIYKGTGVSGGANIAIAYHYQPQSFELNKMPLDSNQLESALKKYKQVLEAAENSVQTIMETSDLDDEQKKIFQAHIDIIQDEAMNEEIEEEILENNLSPEYALTVVYDRYIAIISKSKDALIRERVADLQDVKSRIIKLWFGESENVLSTLTSDVILVAYDLLPSDTAVMKREFVKGIVTEIGGYTSHMAILARNYEIPAVLGVESVFTKIEHGEKIAIDATNGNIVTNLTEAQVKKYQVMRDEYIKEIADLKQYLPIEAKTSDDVKIDICLNIGSEDAGELELEQYTDGVGLFRTEFLYMSKTQLPTEEEQFQIYKKVAMVYGERPVVIRTLDIGGDKKLDYLELPQEENPFLGLRALRLCFEMEPIFKTQLRAILRASIYGNIWIMFPMVGSIGDIRFAKKIIEEVKEELKTEKKEYSTDVKIGIMIEIPSIALMADIAASEVDFASIGTNDLCQYLMAVDRLNSSVAKYYQSFHPAMFRLISQVAKEFEKQGKSISVCGELGGNPHAVILLAGLGIRKFSMNASSIATIKKAITHINIKKAERIARAVLELSTAVQVEHYLTSEIID